MKEINNNSISSENVGSIKITITCSQFAKVFLMREAKKVSCDLNVYVNHILKEYFNGEIKKLGQRKLPAEFVQAIFSYQHQDSQILISLDSSLRELLLIQDKEILAREIKTAISYYLLSVLSDSSEQTRESRRIAKETLLDLAMQEKKPNPSDKLEVAIKV